MKRRICLVCQLDIEYNAELCTKCKSRDNTQVADVFDIDYAAAFVDLIERHVVDITQYTKEIMSNEKDDNNNGIPFQKVYRSFLKTVIHQPFISAILHLDGIRLGKASKLTLWILSCSILEIPPRLREIKVKI